MAKRRSKQGRRADPCAAQRQRLDDIDAQIADVRDQANDPGMPPSVRTRLLAKLKQLQARRRAAWRRWIAAR